MSANGRELSIVIPAYNEAQGIATTLEQLRSVLDDSHLCHEIIVVDDGSTDQTAALVRHFSDVRLICHTHNKGYGATLKTGIRQARYNTIIITDADGTYPVDMIPALAAQIGPYDMVVGARTGDNVHVPLARRPAKWLLNQLANYLTGVAIPDLNSGLRAFKRDIAVSYFRLLPAGFSFTTSITLAMLANDYNVLYMPVDYYQRTGRSKINPIRDTINFFSLVVRVVLSYRPLRVFVPFAIIFLFVSGLKVIYDIITYDFHIATSTVVLLMLTFQWIVLGLIADLVVSLHKN